jgi:glutamate-1-semialdehyde 2,1-aminomutase
VDGYGVLSIGDHNVKFESSKAFQRKSHTLIPGGCHTYAKGDDQYPELAPGFIVKGKGCHVWDVDGNEFIEYGMGLRAVTLGHAYEPVVEAAYRQMLLGNNFTRPMPIEIECAQEMLSLIDGAEMVKFAKNGSDVTTAAVKLARAYTGRDVVAVCADHPFFSVDDWFIGSTAMAAGIPKSERKLTVKFHYNDIDGIKSLFEEYSGQIACVILEAETVEAPKNNFLHELQRLCKENGALFILDEMITGFRWHIGGAQKYYGIVPDLSAFGKGMGNGFSVAALLGKREIMQLGGLYHDQERVFLLSTTHGAEAHSLAAAIETIKIYKREDVIKFFYQQGKRLVNGINQALRENDLHDYFQVVGKPCNLIYVTRDQDKNRSQPFRTLFLQETIKRGLLMPSLVVSFSHTDKDIDRTIEAIGEALYVYRKALDEGVEKYLIGRSVKPVFRSFN